MQIQVNVIDAAWRCGVRKLLNLGSSCIYPKLAPQPIKEDYLLSGSLEPTNEWYAIAKIAGLKMCQAYRRQNGFNAICLMPTNLYGANDNFDLQTSHVLPALLRKIHSAHVNGSDRVVLWGSGLPRRAVRVRHQQAGRNAAQASRRRPSERARLVTTSSVEEWDRGDLRVVSPELRRAHRSLAVHFLHTRRRRANTPPVSPSPVSNSGSAAGSGTGLRLRPSV